MNENITLVVMAAGMGSRFGGLKQIEPIGKNGEILLDYSVYDAVAAGFNKVVFVIKHAIEEDFKAVVGKRIEKMVKTEYVFQETDALPEGFVCPSDRVKPWGTAHAVLCCKDVVKEPFAVINADDYYGKSAFIVSIRSTAPWHGRGLPGWGTHPAPCPSGSAAGNPDRWQWSARRPAWF